MVPVNPDTCRALSDTSTLTSAAMLLPRGNLNSQSRGVLHEPCSAGNCHELGMLGMCHEGPTARASHGEDRSPKHPGERAREDQERQGRHPGHSEATGFRESKFRVFPLPGAKF